MPDLAAILGGGKESVAEMEEEDELPEDPKKGVPSAKLAAIRSLRMALEKGDDEAAASAFESAYRACAMKSEDVSEYED